MGPLPQAQSPGKGVGRAAGGGHLPHLQGPRDIDARKAGHAPRVHSILQGGRAHFAKSLTFRKSKTHKTSGRKQEIVVVSLG